MGYYTDYEIEVKRVVNGVIKDVQKLKPLEPLAMTEMTKEEFVEYMLINNMFVDLQAILKDNLEGCDEEFTGNGKWYDYNEDISELARKHPGFIFIVSGEGEESGDIWKHYFSDKSDEKVEAQIVIPEIDLTEFSKRVE